MSLETTVAPNAATPMTWTRARFLRTLASGWLASVPIVLLVMLAVEAVPRTRGLAFFSQLRYAVVAPACVLVAVAAACAWHWLSERSRRPRLALATILLGLAGVLLLGMAWVGPAGLALAGLPAIVTVAVAAVWFVPRSVERPWRLRTGTVALVLLGVLEASGVVAALASERLGPPGPQGLAFDIPRTMFDVEHRFIDLPSGARVHYVDEGQGETLLFLHGNPSWSFQWRDLIHGLRGSYRCIALDYPGFGLSQAPEGFGFTPREESRVVEELVDRLGLRDVTLVMQDWGGPIGIALAERRPELVKRVILGSTWAWRTSTSEPRGKWSVIAGGPVGEFIQANFNGIATLALKDSIARELPADVADVYARPFRPLDRRGIAAFYPGQITAASDWFGELEAGLPAFKDKQALIFWALEDPGFPRTDLARWEQTFPNHKTVELAHTHHFFFEDTASEVIANIRAFMTSDVAPR
ncbi:alpha/beta fold hydrolase [Pyxidicoccus parkwayensis]|uniref:Alpha/beta fold hydrolase n=1 Tax=Pyxidicoccus parkwayensis TaxID=2813578 RepID=A0ABX7NKW7_9BACT|nr:alpha/beta fold hydrolase [Pyxidicoccus parkwaysis]QSQ19497.1 alpha/beta fold hydrolase [Pyxidicoccus parkwaysis]